MLRKEAEGRGLERKQFRGDGGSALPDASERRGAGRGRGSPDPNDGGMAGPTVMAEFRTRTRLTKVRSAAPTLSPAASRYLHPHPHIGARC